MTVVICTNAKTAARQEGADRLMIMNLYLLITILFLGILSVSDIRTKTIPGWSAPLYCVVVGVLHLILGDLSAWQLLAGLIPGAILLLLSWIFSSSIGAGDGLAVLACGCALGLEREFAALTAALIICAIFGMILLVRKKAKRTDTLPFLPFLTASHIVMFVSGVIL